MDEIQTRSISVDVLAIIDALDAANITMSPMDIAMRLLVATIGMTYLKHRNNGLSAEALETFLIDSYTAVTTIMMSSVEATIDVNTKLPPEKVN